MQDVIKHLDSAISNLKTQAEDVKNQIATLEKARSVLEPRPRKKRAAKARKKTVAYKSPKKRKYTLSEESRAKLSARMKARWDAHRKATEEADAG